MRALKALHITAHSPQHHHHSPWHHARPPSPHGPAPCSPPFLWPLLLPGTSLRYKPGVVVCGAGQTHDCGTSRSIGYFIEPLLLLGLFGKKVCTAWCAHLRPKPYVPHPCNQLIHAPHVPRHRHGHVPRHGHGHGHGQNSSHPSTSTNLANK